jgi:hypothetical protein
LNVVNDTIVGHKDIRLPPLLTATLTTTNALVFVVGNRFRAEAYEPYLSLLRHALDQNGLPTTAAVVSERWTRFVLNGILTTATMEQVRYQLSMLYPELRMGRDPRWLTTESKRVGKEASSVVITLVGQLTMKDVVDGPPFLYLFNREIRLRDYLSFGPTTRCGRCCLYGHPTTRCTAETPTCAVCAEPHFMRKHPCKIPRCPRGGECTHAPFRCASCGGPHKATDRMCPAFCERIAQRQQTSDMDLA